MLSRRRDMMCALQRWMEVALALDNGCDLSSTHSSKIVNLYLPEATAVSRGRGVCAVELDVLGAF